ncbi:MAG TPA: flagellar basal body rod protein FlgB [Arcobacter sp.]|jgi:flagellar basal-body rod protein FlgB|nr:flagellar basal body rod protein FlgB [Arcobacter sp.]
MHASEVSNLLFKNLDYRAQRQKVIAGNIANINTPNYKTKDVSFEQELQKAQKSNDLKLKITHHNHIPFEINNGKINHKPEVFEVKGLEEQNDGNNVSLDSQISEMSKNSVIYDAIKNSIKKDARWFKLMVDASSKN